MATVYEIITNKFVEALEQGRIPWQKPWNVDGLAYNHTTGKRYGLLNQMLLGPGEYLTFEQAKKEGGKVKKGEKGSLVVSYFEKYDKDEDGNDIPSTKRVLPRYYYVFEVSQCEGIERKQTEEPKHLDPIKEAQEVMDDYFSRETVELRHHRSDKAYYQPGADLVVLPEMGLFKSAAHYYGVAFHEMTHSTMTKDRCNRAEERYGKNVAFGSQEYSKEELVAEIGSSFLTSHVGIDSAEIFENSKAYVQGWASKLKSDPKFIIEAAAKAEKAAKYILGEQ